MRLFDYIDVLNKSNLRVILNAKRVRDSAVQKDYYMLDKDTLDMFKNHEVTYACVSLHADNICNFEITLGAPIRR